ncbi:MAG: hypothetical protein KME07_10135 [Pegethrix bostrychoides GSE-TBD4-15B]|jgi:hypothetical protein|uniref:Uncharacterized protein n=1 Tax=Pegethrix bostrychoides GSE-TBD4-15B TaxID=2839662 RepID=A0A951U4L4_9CYAN|nr:hypothetical protein [Pegethrix bostrychoides GSE-TBD4-15B]
MKLVGRKAEFRNAAVLVLGLLISSVAVSKLQHPATPAQDREELRASLLFVGPPLLGLGGWLIYFERRQAQQQQQMSLQDSFFQLLKKNRGYINVIQFSIASGLDGKLAKAYLDKRALEFNADYDVSEVGNITYYFELESADLAISRAAAGTTAESARL